MKTTFCLICLFLFISEPFKAQLTDSISNYTDTTSKSSLNKKRVYAQARRSTIMSAILPGLGQAYNKKYWKIPIIYAGLGGFGYMFAINNESYQYYLENLQAVYDDDPNTVNTSGYNANQLQVLKDQYSKNRDFAIIGFAVVYILNIIDANIDGHLSTFDVSDNLGLHIDPWQRFETNSNGNFQSAVGLSLKLNFK